VIDWHIITGEYPPQAGGVSDYTRLVAEGLADAGDAVTVWAPKCAAALVSHSPAIGGVEVRRLPDHFGLRSLRTLSRELDRRPAPRRMLVQYVPQAFGWKGANVAFCAWLRSRTRDSIWVMFHEVAYPFGADQGLSHNALAAVNRLMASLVAGVAERAFVSIPAWQPQVQRLMGARSVEWTPVPSSVPVAADSCETARVRGRYAYGAPLVGHFGTYGRAIRALIEPVVRAIGQRTRAQMLLLGRRSDELARDLETHYPELKGRIAATGPLTADELSHHIAACDVMIQPYPDGISARRTSAMAALAHGRPIVTTTGWLTESLWEDSGAVSLVPVDAPDAMALATARLLDDPVARDRLSANARTAYAARFDLAHTIRALRYPRTG
jgi:glycosyltransferase involved in cell wall biosynthesis